MPAYKSENDGLRDYTKDRPMMLDISRTKEGVRFETCHDDDDGEPILAAS